MAIGQVFVSPPAARLNEGDSLVFSAALWDDLGNPLPSGANVVWSSDDPDRASVTSEGVVRGLQRGDATIRATFQGVTGTATVTVVVAAGVTVSPLSGPTTEAGGHATFTVVLESAPLADVTIGVSSSDTDEGTVSVGSLIFTRLNWSAPQTVTVTGVDDALADGNVAYSIVTTATTSTDPGYNGLEVADVPVTNIDNETAGITVSPPSGPTTESGGQATFTVVLNSQPSASVTIGLSTSNADEGTVSPASLTFTPANWNAAQTVTVTGVDDALADGNVVYSVLTAPATSTDAGYDGLDAVDAAITNTDDETAGITVSPPSEPTTEAGGQATFTVVLNSLPSSDVTIALTSSDPTEGTVSPTSLTFTDVNWNAPQSVTVTGVDDVIADGNVIYSIVTAAASSTDPRYGGLDAADVSITNTDNETAGIRVSPPSGPTTEGGGQATFTVALNSQPSANVTIGLTSSDATEGSVSPTSLTFTSASWNAAQTVTVTGIDDAIADGNVVYSIVTAAATSSDASYNGLDAADVSITNTDNETAGVAVSPPSGPTTEAGGQATFTVVLNSQPSANVTIGLTSSDTSEGTVSPASLTFTGVNWNAAQTVTVAGVDDVIADGNVIYSIVTAAATSTDPNYAGLDAADLSITNTDDETAGITVSPPSGPTTEGGGQATFTVVLNSQPAASVTIGLSSSDPTEGTISPTSLTFTSVNWDAAQTVTVTGVDDAIADGNVVYSALTGAATSTDASYSGLDAADVSVTNNDNEAAGITISPPSGPTTEGGGQATFTVVLNSQPTANVSIGLTSSDATEGTISPTSLTFTTGNWNAARTVTVTGVDDAIADGNVVYSALTAAATSTDPNYNGLDAPDVSITNTDNETAGITVSPPSGPTTEGGGQATFTVVLNSQPTTDVSLGLTSSDVTEGTVSPASMTFTSVNWNAPQTVTVTGVDDALADGNIVYSIVTSAATSTDVTYTGLNAADVPVTNTDDETAGISVSPPSGPTTEGGGQATFTVVLNSQPTASVAIALSSSDATEGLVSPTSLTFTTANWNGAQTVTVTGVDDALADGNVVYSIVTATATSTDGSYNGLNASDVLITNTDDESAGITVSPPSGPTTEGGGQATFTVGLNSQPTADVTVALSSSDATEGTVSPTSLTFTGVNWNAAQTVTVTGADDALADGNVVYSIVTAAATSTDPSYSGLNAADVSITNNDDETAGITVSPPSGPTTEGGGQATFSVVLSSQPSANVTVGLTSNDTSEGTVSPASLTFTGVNWNAAQTVTVTGIDDAIADGNVAYSIVTAAATSTDPDYAGLNAADVSITNTDNEAAGITVSPPSGPTTEAGGQATFTVVLNSQPSANVAIAISSSDTGEGTSSPTSLTFTTANWNAAQTVTVTGVDDALADGNIVYSIVTAPATSTDPNYTGLNAVDVSITNNDNETAGITVSPPSGPTTEGGGQATFTVVLNSQPTADVTVGLSSSDATEGAVSPAALTFTTANWNAAQTVTATGVDDAIADGNVVYSVLTAAATSTDPNYAGLNASNVSLTNNDDETAGVTVSPPSGPTTEAGGQATFTVVLNSQPSANVSIGLSSSDTGEGTVSPTSLTFTVANWNAAQAVTVAGVDDALADGNVVYSIVTAPATSADPNYTGLNAVDVSITNNDNETAGFTVAPLSGPTTEAGGQATFTVVLNSQPAANVAIGLASSDATEGTVSPTSLTFTTANWNAAQTVTVTGVDDAIADGNVVYSIVTAAATSTDPNYNALNAVDVSVTNTDNETAGITVSPPSGPTTEAGGQATFTVVLNSQPTANVSVGLTSSDATEGSVAPASLTFTTGNWNAAQTVTVTGIDDALADGNVVYSIFTAAATSTDATYTGLDAADVSVTNT
ncbi:MAG: Ig-like domain-containing protein, partial [Acidobacteriota bacterium]|nr:Ig-like domain-containing protein [Acidobacteriota bacterium]